MWRPHKQSLNEACPYNNSYEQTISTDGASNSVFVSGDDVYLVGEDIPSGTSSATFWKVPNGSLGILVQAEPSTSMGESRYIFVVERQ